MPLASYLLASILSVGWSPLGTNKDGDLYEFLDSSIKVDVPSKSVQLDLRTTFAEEQTMDGKKVKVLHEPVLVLCDQKLMITLSTTLTEASGKKSVLSRAQVYNAGSPGQFTYELVKSACQNFENVTPSKPKSLGISV